MFTASQLLEKVNAYINSLAYARHPLGLYEPIQYALSLGGKRIRPVLMLMAYNLYHEEVDAILSQAAGIETYHNYTLLHDDLMDKADLRRGKPTVHKVWNDNAAILSGDAMLVLAYQLMAEGCGDHLHEVIQLFSNTAMEICEGQQLDMEFETRMDVTEEEYLEMIRLKTSVLLACSLKIGAMMADASAKDAQALYDFGMNLGVAFQLKDDLLDVYGDTDKFGKNIGGDILSNKKTYLLIQALRHADETQRQALNHWIEAEAFNPQEKIAGVTALYNKIGVRALCEEKIAHYTSVAEQNLTAVNLPEARKSELAALMRKLMYREA